MEEHYETRMDEVYIDRVLKGDYNAFQYFVKTYQTYVYSISFAILKDAHLAEDAVQDAYINAFKGLNKFRRDAEFKTWLGKIVINESLKKVDKRKIETDFILDDSVYASANEIEYMLLPLERAEQKYYITLVFEQLKANESLVLELFYLKEHSIAEINKLTGWSNSKIKMLLLRGREQFYRKLKMILKSELREII